MFFNTTGEDNRKTLEKYAVQAKSQDEIILAYFQKHKFGTPSAVQRLALGETPITSIRRSISTLTKRGKLEKTGKTAMGSFGRPEGIWQVTRNEVQQ